MNYYSDNQIVENSILKGYDGNIPEILNIRAGVKTVLGEKTRKDSNTHRFGFDIFYNSYNQNNILKEVICPNSVNKIGAKAFEHAHALNRIHLPESIEEIKLSAFLGCYSLKEITLPLSIKVLDIWCFSLIPNLVINYPGTKDEFNNIIKGDEWCNKGTKLICSDGEIYL